MTPIKIFLCDNPQHKTTAMLKKHWEEDDRFELLIDPYFNAPKAKWADVTWMEWCETGMNQASQRKGRFEGMYDDFTDPGHKTPVDWEGDWYNTKLINRAIDIDVHFGHYRGVDWSGVDHLVFIAKHIRDIVLNDPYMKDKLPKELPIHHIPLSINLDDWTFKDRKKHGKNIAFVHHLWAGKGLPLALQAMKKIVEKDSEFKMHIVGGWSNEKWLPPYVYHMIKQLKLEDNVIIQGQVGSVDNFLDEMDYIFSSSYKEAFSLITAEGMAKGLKPLIHNWEGSQDIWGEKYVWNTIDELVDMVFSNFDSNEYRTFVERYDWKHECEAADKLIFS